MPATMRDVAKLAGVSVKTVSNVVNNTYPYIRPETRAQVEAAMAELGYRLNVTARKLRTNRTGLIGLALPELRHQYFAELADDVIREAAKAGLKVIIEQVEPSEHVAVERLVGSHTHLVDGAIVAPVGHGDVVSESAPPGFPVVVLGDHRITDDVDQVYMANARGAELVMEHLISRGARRIVALGADLGAVVGAEGERTRGYLESLERHGIEVDDQLILTTDGWSKAVGVAAIRDLTTRGVSFDAVFGFNDTLALGALTEVLRSGRRVPEDVQVMGFDNIDDAQYSVPALSTVAVDRAQLAELAVDMIVRRLRSLYEAENRSEHDAEGAAPERWAIEVPASLVLRDSTRQEPRP
ncbi:LacI family DNA-binding transcriptional regulator [Ruania rhizosphaerae]|uniref:LacI family DNA-binding transcriptional regulator n=1 Tax=Ruania rhizosphaerae TaxID=1840413 RepID=UPI0013599DC5|nr:LacI family DNA-binding transcriptional regulator [Ruania rhizosphaerae]